MRILLIAGLLFLGGYFGRLSLDSSRPAAPNRAESALESAALLALSAGTESFESDVSGFRERLRAKDPDMTAFPRAWSDLSKIVGLGDEAKFTRKFDSAEFRRVGAALVADCAREEADWRAANAAREGAEKYAVGGVLCLVAALAVGWDLLRQRRLARELAAHFPGIGGKSVPDQFRHVLKEMEMYANLSAAWERKNLALTERNAQLEGEFRKRTGRVADAPPPDTDPPPPNGSGPFPTGPPPPTPRHSLTKITGRMPAVKMYPSTEFMRQYDGTAPVTGGGAVLTIAVANRAYLTRLAGPDAPRLLDSLLAQVAGNLKKMFPDDELDLRADGADHDELYWMLPHEVGDEALMELRRLVESVADDYIYSDLHDNRVHIELDFARFGGNAHRVVQAAGD